MLTPIKDTLLYNAAYIEDLEHNYIGVWSGLL